MNRQRLIITSTISIVLISILMISSTYSIFTTSEVDENTNVYATGNLNITYTLANNNIKLTNVTPISREDENTIIPYRITVTNTGTVPYQFNVILNDTTASNVIDYKYIMTKVGYLDSKPLSECNNNIIKEGVILPANSSVDIDVRIWLSNQIKNSEIGKSFYAKLTIDGLAIYNESEDINNDILSLTYMKHLFNLYTDFSYYRSDTYREYIKTASFVNYIETDTSKIINSWDVSEEGDEGSVIAWLENNKTSGYYDLYIGSNEKIYAKSLSGLFSHMTSLENIAFDNLSTALTNSMSEMFYSNYNLISLDISTFNTVNVTNMIGMFQNCINLTSIDISNFNTSRVESMASMFAGCNSLMSLVLSEFDTSKVENMSHMFSGCISLTSLDISNFDTSNVTTMHGMFYNCRSLINLDVSGFNTSKVESMLYMFSYCSNLTSLDLSNFDTSNVTTMHGMFYDCSNLTTTINITTTTTTSYDYMFDKAATNAGAIITVNYTNDTSSLVDNMIATKTSNSSNVVKGSLID